MTKRPELNLEYSQRRPETRIDVEPSVSNQQNELITKYSKVRGETQNDLAVIMRGGEILVEDQNGTEVVFRGNRNDYINFRIV